MSTYSTAAFLTIRFADFDRAQQRRQQFTDLILKYRTQLATLYRSQLAPALKREQKAAILAAMKEDYERLKALLPRAHFKDFRAEQIRVCRSKTEVECVRRANNINRAALAETIDAMEPGWSEWDIVMHLCAGHEKRLGEEYFYSATGATVCQVGEHMLHMHVVRTPHERRRRRVARGDGGVSSTPCRRRPTNPPT